MTILDDMNPFQSVAPPAMDTSAAATTDKPGAVADFYSVTGRVETSVGQREGRPAEREPVDWHHRSRLTAPAPFHPPAGYVLVERELLGRVVKRLWQQSERERRELLQRAFIGRFVPDFAGR